MKLRDNTDDLFVPTSYNISEEGRIFYSYRHLMLYSAYGLDIVSGCKIFVRKSSCQYGEGNASFAFSSANDSDYEEDYNQVMDGGRR